MEHRNEKTKNNDRNLFLGLKISLKFTAKVTLEQAAEKTKNNTLTANCYSTDMLNKQCLLFFFEWESYGECSTPVGLAGDLDFPAQLVDDTVYDR